MSLLKYVLNRRSFLKGVVGATTATMLPVVATSAPNPAVDIVPVNVSPKLTTVRPPRGAWIQIDDCYFSLVQASIDISNSLPSALTWLDRSMCVRLQPLITIRFSTHDTGGIFALPCHVDIGDVKVNFPDYGIMQFEDAKLMSVIYDMNDVASGGPVLLNGEIVSKLATVYVSS